MAFALRSEENNVPAREPKAGAKSGLLQQGSKRRALGDIGNSLISRNAKAGADAAAKAPSRPAPAAPLAAAPLLASTSAAAAAAAAPRCTRSQTAAMRQQAPAAAAGGASMSTLLETRSALAAVAAAAARTSRPAAPAPSSAPAVVDIDKADHHNPLAASEYVNDIYTWYRSAEVKFRVQPDYIGARQTEVNEQMRAILVDWLVEVHLNFKLMPESLYLTVNLIDRFLELKPVNRKSLQLVGVTAMLIASKYEEIWAPEVKDFVDIADKAYTRQQILSMEKLMLNTLRFNLTVATPYNFLVRFLKAAGVDKEPETVALATYLVELSLPNYAMLQHSPSAVAAAAVYAAMRAAGRPAGAASFPRALAGHSGYSEAQTLPVASALVQIMELAPDASLKAVYKKYGSSKRDKSVRAAERQPPLRIIAEALQLAK